ncbi:unnamed protein product [Acanthoscelides obtectus]|uniref:Transposase domain-containing protein n=1 Tax=Acanthoscelides obtectus TaxID=200917 RepID=A0A9P0M1Z1_ACAOB|nr:unnamed protein product [Acanthoscelides obtectus]CAK1654763.1 hypothetical protein AOBTE_LOCUS18824 [Acanthoscelides obtectus]
MSRSEGNHKKVVVASPQQQSINTVESSNSNFDVAEDILSNSNNIEPDLRTSNQSCSVQIGRELEENSDVIDDNSIDENNELSLKDELQCWATNFKISHTALKDLLHILSSYHPELPLVSRTLLQTPKKFDIKSFGSGEYVYLGIKNNLEKFIRQHDYKNDTLILNFNIDGIPLYKSSNMQAWPILGSLKVDNMQKVFAIGIYCDTKKYLVKLGNFICDAAAKSFIKGIKAPGGYSCCDKCTAEGEYINGRVVLRDTNARKRTDHSFRLKLDDDHHVGTTPLVNLEIDMIQNFPIDYMHNICLDSAVSLLIYNSTHEMGKVNCDLSSNLIHRFIKEWEQIYGTEFLIYKVHILHNVEFALLNGSFSDCCFG